MENNNQFVTSSAKVYIKQENAIMLTESKIDHIESLLKRANELEKPKFRRYIPGVFTSIATFSCGFAVTNLLAIHFDFITVKNQSHIFILIVVAIAAAVLIAKSLIEEFFRESDYKSYTAELLDVINKSKGTISADRISD